MHTHIPDTPSGVITPTAPTKGPEVVKDNNDDKAPKEPDKWKVVLTSEQHLCEWVIRVISVLFGRNCAIAMTLMDFSLNASKFILVKGVTRDFAESKAAQAMEMLSKYPTWACGKCLQRYAFFAEKDGD